MQLRISWISMFRLFFREIRKGGVSVGLTVGRNGLLPLAIKRKKISSGFFNGNPSGGQIFHHRNPILLFMFLMQNPKSVFQNLNLVLPIESTQNFRAVFPIFHMYSRLFWTLLNRNKIIFYWFTDVSTFRDTFSPTITLEIVKRK